jgi:hypothetical protein
MLGTQSKCCQSLFFAAQGLNGRRFGGTADANPSFYQKRPERGTKAEKERDIAQAEPFFGKNPRNRIAAASHSTHLTNQKQ